MAEPAGLRVLPVTGMGEITAGADLAAAVLAAAPWLRDGDVLVVTSKIVSKAEGRLVDVPAVGPEREVVRADVLAAETAEVVAQRGPTTIVRTHHGFVMAAAGVDASNVEPTRLVLLPKDPDGSARSLRAALRERFDLDVAVVVSDTAGRPWRLGLTDIALGAAGIAPVRDHRGQTDPYGNELVVTLMAVVDEVAGAAELVKGKAEGIPVAVVRGLLPAARRDAPDGPGAAALIRDPAEDMFTLGTAEARAAGLADAATLPDAPAFGPGPVDRVALDRALRRVADLPVRVSRDADPVELTLPAGDDPVGLGVDLHRLRCALAAEGLASARTGDRLTVGRPA
jgi:coenzyme F420-0:L-glutamate ligase/coenzyme F420-1:gamma-L-glutamate ligase